MPDEPQHTFGVRCPECGHVTYFDKRDVCSGSAAVYRGDTYIVHGNVESGAVVGPGSVDAENIASEDIVERASERERDPGSTPIESPGGKHKLYVACAHCGFEMTAYVDCEGYT